MINSLPGPIVDTSVVLALISLLGLFIKVFITDARKRAEEIGKTSTAFLERIEELEKTVAKCHDERMKDREEIGKLREQVFLLRQLIERTVVAPMSARFVVDTAGVILNVTPNIESLLGFRPNELVGHNIEMLIPVELRGQHEAAFRQRVNDSEIRIDAVVMRMQPVLHRVGPPVQCQINLREMPTEDGHKEFVADVMRVD